MVHSEKKQMDVNLLLKSIWQKKWLIVICILGVLVSVIIFNQLSSPIYEVRTTIIFEHSNDAMDTISPFRPLDKSIINNELEKIKSVSLVEDVIESLPEDIVNSFPVPKKKPADFNPKRYFTERIRKNISAENIVGSDVIIIKTKANSQKTAVVLAHTITEVLKKRNLNTRYQSISNVRKLIEDQLKIYEQKLRTAEENLRDCKEKGEIAYIDQESTEILKRITEAEILYNKARANRDASEKRLQYLQNKLSDDRQKLLPTITEITSPMVKQLKNELIDLEMQYTRLKVQNYAENHAKMLELKSQIDRTKQKLINETLKISRGDNIIDPLSQIQQRMEEIVSIEVEVQTHRAQEKTLEKIIKDYENELSTMPEKELTLVRLVRDKEVNDKIYTLLMEKREEARIHEAEKFGNIRVLDPPQIPEKPIWPKKLLNLILGLFFGLILGLGLAVFIEYTDNRLRTAEQIRKITDLNVVGTIPKLRKGLNATLKSYRIGRGKTNRNTLSGKLISSHNPKSVEVEAFRTLRTNLQFSGLATTTKTILITSCMPGEGKSLITANLGIAVAQLGLKTLLIDADLRKPRQHSLFNKERKPGLSNIIFAEQITPSSNQNIMDVETASHEDITNKLQPGYQNENENENSDVILDYIKTEKIIHHTQTSGLDLLSSGSIPPNPADGLALPIMRRIVNLLKKQYNVVLLDSPPINVVVDASLLSSMVDGVLLVVKSGVNTEFNISKAKELLDKANTKILGIVTNFTDEEFHYTDYYSENGHM